MNIKYTSREYTKADLYKAVKQAINAKDYEKGRFTIDGYIEYEDTNSKGETVSLLVLSTTDGEFIATQSETIKNDFKEILEIFDEDCTAITELEILSGTSKAGRKFYSLLLC